MTNNLNNFIDLATDWQTKVLLRDKHKLKKLAAAIVEKKNTGQDFQYLENKFFKIYKQSLAQLDRRQASPINFKYPEELPVVQAKQQILSAIQQSQVVIIASETGSGKTTQLPKFCLELGRGLQGLIGHTQPRRIAAHAVSQRIADELETKLGDIIGYQVRFHDRVSDSTRVKLMTDGILLSEIEYDPLLLNYDTLIVDEAHERSLNIDFILGILKRIRNKRPDLKIIITSATMDTEALSEHFDNAPVIRIEGRNFPVDIHYRDYHLADEESDERDLVQAVCKACEEALDYGGGDILVFLPSEKDILDCRYVLSKRYNTHIEILPLYARLSISEQAKVFQQSGRRRIILSTNVAETSLTVPNIRFVIDSGLVRISRYSFRNKVQRLPIEKISQASANQRAGRCGRVGPGYCIRLYDESDYLVRDEYTDPEIIRTNLAAVILKMLSSRLGDINDFPFIEKPDRRYINDGYRLLFELGAIDKSNKLTGLGRRMARFPVDPRIARMLIAAENEACLSEILVIASALSIQDPRERPADSQKKADQAHQEFNHEKSDFLTFLNMWNILQQRKRKLSNSQFKKYCQQSFISPRRFREWQDTYQQLKLMAKDCKLSINQSEASEDNIHRALLSGLLSFVGNKLEKKLYLGGHGKQFLISPASILFESPPKWLMAATIVETSQLYAHIAGPTTTQDLIKLAGPVLTRHYSDPYWSSKRASVMVKEKITLYGLVLAVDRPVYYNRIDQKHAREIFIEQGLLSGELDDCAEFLLKNRDCLSQLKILEAKLRKQGYLINDSAIYEFYKKKLPHGVYDKKSLQQWLKQATPEQQAQLCFEQDDVLVSPDYLPKQENYPDKLNIGEFEFNLEYLFDPDSSFDGITVIVPLELLPQISSADFEFLVPGLLAEKIEYLIRNLPKALRRNLVSIRELCNECQARITQYGTSFYKQMADLMTRLNGMKFVESHFRHQSLPNYLCMHFRIIDEAGKILAQGSDLAQLQQQFQIDSRRLLRNNIQLEHFNKPLLEWNFGKLEQELRYKKNNIEYLAYPALEDTVQGVQLRLFETPALASAAMPAGIIALFKLVRKNDVSYLAKNIPQFKQLSLSYSMLGQANDLRQDMVDFIIKQALFADSVTITDAKEFEQACAQAVSRLMSTANTVSELLLNILTDYRKLNTLIQQARPPLAAQTREDLEWQLGYLIYEGFLTQIDLSRLCHYPRYLAAAMKRIEKLRLNPQKDNRLMAEVANWWQKYLDYEEKYRDSLVSSAIEEFHWMIEEYRVSLFAQELKSAVPVSEKRLAKCLSKLEGYIRDSIV